MNYTRDPIIETVITPREGCKLVVRSSKGINQEDFFVDALEVVSFGHALFFRSQERPKSFLVPVSDYEVFESKETKMLLKNPSMDRSIKIGGGKDLSQKMMKEPQVQEIREDLAPSVSDRNAPQQDRQDRKQRDKRRRGKKGRDRREGFVSGSESTDEMSSKDDLLDQEMEKAPLVEEVKEKAPSFISKLFPPPTTLIKETLSRYKSVDPAPEDLQAQVTSTQVEEIRSEPKFDVSYDETDIMDIPEVCQENDEDEQ